MDVSNLVLTDKPVTVDVAFAIEYGLEAAVIVSTLLVRWHPYEASKYDLSLIASYFPFWEEDEVDRHIRRCIDRGVLGKTEVTSGKYLYVNLHNKNRPKTTDSFLFNDRSG